MIKENRNWNKEEIEFFANNYETMSDRQLARALGKSIQLVGRFKAKFLEEKRNLTYKDLLNDWEDKMNFLLSKAVEEKTKTGKTNEVILSFLNTAKEAFEIKDEEFLIEIYNTSKENILLRLKDINL